VCGTFLLLLGNITDIVGSRRAFLFGCILYSIFTLVQGFCNSGGQLIAFRAIQGFAMAACLPSAVSALTNSFPAGRWRNLGFLMLSAGQPLVSFLRHSNLLLINQKKNRALQLVWSSAVCSSGPLDGDGSFTSVRLSTLRLASVPLLRYPTI
jgi:MFS family permease